MPWYDVHFSYNGFMKIEADNSEDAAEICEQHLKQHQPAVEKMLSTGVGVEIADVIQEDGEDFDEETVNCEHCGKSVVFNGDDDFNFEVPSNHFPAPFDRSKGVCRTCWENAGYKKHYEKYYKEIEK